MKKFMKVIDTAEEKILVYSFLASIVIITLQVIMRYVFNNSLSWSEELSRYLFIWQGWLGVSFCERYRQHISIDILKDSLKGVSKKIMEIVAIIISIACSAGLVYFGFKVVGKLMNSASASTALRLPMWIVYSSLPVGSALYCLRAFIKLIETITGKQLEEEGNGEVEVQL